MSNKKELYTDKRPNIQALCRYISLSTEHGLLSMFAIVIISGKDSKAV